MSVQILSIVRSFLFFIKGNFTHSDVITEIRGSLQTAVLIPYLIWLELREDCLLAMRKLRTACGLILTLTRHIGNLLK